MIESNTSVGWRVMDRRDGWSPTKGSTMDNKCNDSRCSSGVSLNWHPPIREGIDPRSLMRILKAKKGSVRSYELRLVSTPEDQAEVDFLTRDFVVPVTVEPLLSGRDDALDIALGLDIEFIVFGSQLQALELCAQMAYVYHPRHVQPCSEVCRVAWVSESISHGRIGRSEFGQRDFSARPDTAALRYPFVMQGEIDESSPLLRPNPSGHENAGSTDGTGGNDSTSQDPGEERSETTAISYLSFVLPMAIGIFLAAMDQTIVVSSYAAIGSELKQLQKTSWIATAYMLTLTSFQPLYGKLSDIFGRKSCLLFAYCVFAIGSLLCGLSRNMTELIVSRAVAGIGGGGMTTIVSIVMSDVVPLRSRGTWQGVLNIVFASGSATGAPLGGFLVDTIGWRWAFLFQVPIVVLAIVSVSLALHLPKADSSDLSTKLMRVDFGGAITLVLTVFFLLFGLDRGSNSSWADTLTVISFGGFSVFFILFSLVELKLASEPFAPKHIIFNDSLIASFLVNMFGMASAMSMIFHVSLYLQAVTEKSASEAGLWLILSVAGGLVGSLVGGLAIQATGRFYAITVGAYLAMFIGAGIIVLMTGVFMQSLPGLAIGLLTASFGNGAGVVSSLIALIANAGPADQAIATAVSYLFRSLGAAIGISVGSTLVQETLRSYLRRNLSGNDVEEIIQRVRESLTYVNELDAYTQTIVRSGYATAIRVALSFTLLMATFALVASVFIKEKSLPTSR